LAQVLAILTLLKKLISKELSSVSSVKLNNLLFCALFLMFGRGETPKDAFWSTLFFQLVLLAPLLVTFSVDTQHRLPSQRVATWPLTGIQCLFLSFVSFALNPLFIVLFVGFVVWMGFAVALVFVVMALAVHVTVYAISRVPSGLRLPAAFSVPRAPLKVGGIAQAMWREITATLDFWTALLIAVSGTLYRLLGRAPAAEAFPMLALFVGIAMSTLCQRMLDLDEGRALLRYRLLPVQGWKLLLTQDLIFLLLLGAMVSLLRERTGIAFGLVAVAVGRYPSLKQRRSQRRWRFVGGDPRFGVAQVILGGVAGIGAARIGPWFLAAAVVLYVGSLFWGQLLWRRSMTA
jgi:hypothetical protein